LTQDSGGLVKKEYPNLKNWIPTLWRMNYLALGRRRTKMAFGGVYRDKKP